MLVEACAWASSGTGTTTTGTGTGTGCRLVHGKSGSESVSADARRQLVGFRRSLASPNRNRPDSFARARLRSRDLSDETLITANYASGPLNALRDLARSPAISR